MNLKDFKLDAPSFAQRFDYLWHSNPKSKPRSKTIFDKVHIRPIVSKAWEEIKDADIIYHLAGISDVATVKEKIDINHEKKVFAVGVEGTRNIINLSSESAKIVFPSTHVIFEGLKKVEHNIDETHEPNPVLDYAKGKLQSENDLIKSNNINLKSDNTY